MVKMAIKGSVCIFFLFLCFAIPGSLFITALGLHGKVLVVGSYRGDFCDKLLEISPVSNRGNASQLKDRPAVGQG